MANIKSKWLRDALAELGDNAPGQCALEAKLVGGRVVLTTSVIGTKEATNSFAQVVRQKTQAYFAQIRPGYFRSCKREHIRQKREAEKLERERQRMNRLREAERQRRNMQRKEVLRKLKKLKEEEHPLA